MTDEYPIVHSDSERPEDAKGEEHHDITFTSEGPPEYMQKQVNDNIRQFYEKRRQRGFDITIESPVEDAEQLPRRRHLTAQFHNANQNHWEEKDHENDGTLLYDIGILSVLEDKLEHEDIALSDFDPKTRPWVRAYSIQEARGQQTTEFREYLQDDKTLQSKIGFDTSQDLPSYSTIRRRFKNIKQQNNFSEEKFRNAVTRAVYAVYRAGIESPENIKQANNFNDVEPPLNENAVDRESNKEALREFVQFLLDRTTHPLTFGRDNATSKFSIDSFIGAFAASALYEYGLEDIKDVCDWDYPRERIPGGGWPRDYITQRLDHGSLVEQTIDETNQHRNIQRQFTDVHERTLAVARELGIWSPSNPLNIAVDMFRVDWTGKPIDETINRPEKPENDSVTEQWTYLIASSVDLESRLILGGTRLNSKSEYPKQVRGILTQTYDDVNLNSVVVDGEIVSGGLIDVLREFVDDDWIISAPDKEPFISLASISPEKHSVFVEGVRWGSDNPVTAVSYPYSEGSKDDRSDSRDHMDDSGEGDSLSDPIEVDRKHLENYESDESEDSTQTKLEPAESQPSDSQGAVLPSEIEELASQSEVGNSNSHAVYITDRDMPVRSVTGVRFRYLQRWAIEETIDEVKNNFMPYTESEEKNQRLYALHIGILFYNWHKIINSCVGPIGIPLDVTHQELLKAIQDVAFSDADDDS